MAGVLRMPFQRFLLADALYAIPGINLLFWLAYVFTDERVGGRTVKPRCDYRGRLAEPRVVRDQLGEWRQFQRADRNPMGVLGVEHAQHRPRKRLEQADHGISSGKTCC